MIEQFHVPLSVPSRTYNIPYLLENQTFLLTHICGDLTYLRSSENELLLSIFKSKMIASYFIVSDTHLIISLTDVLFFTFLPHVRNHDRHNKAVFGVLKCIQP